MLNAEENWSGSSGYNFPFQFAFLVRFLKYKSLDLELESHLLLPSFLRSIAMINPTRMLIMGAISAEQEPVN